MLLVPFIVAEWWSANRSRIEHADELRDQAGALAAAAGAYLNQYLSGLDSMASALARHPAVIAHDRAEAERVLAAVLHDLGFPPAAGQFVFMVGRVAGLTAEVAEEYAREKPMRIRIPVLYDGVPPRPME